MIMADLIHISFLKIGYIRPSQQEKTIATLTIVDFSTLRVNTYIILPVSGIPVRLARPTASITSPVPCGAMCPGNVSDTITYKKAM